MKYKYSIVFLIVCAVLLAVLFKMYRKDVLPVESLPVVEDSMPSTKPDIVPAPVPIVEEEEVLYDVSASLLGNKITYTRNGTTVKFTKPNGWDFREIEPGTPYGYLQSKIDSGFLSEPEPEKIYYEIAYAIDIDGSYYFEDEYNEKGFQEETITLADGTEVKLFTSTSVPSMLGEYTYLIQIPDDTKYFVLILRPFAKPEGASISTGQRDALNELYKTIASLEFK